MTSAAAAADSLQRPTLHYWHGVPWFTTTDVNLQQLLVSVLLRNIRIDF
jgi:hypothetical protein